MITRFSKDLYLNQTACDLETMVNRYKLSSGMTLTSLTASLRNLDEGRPFPAVYSKSKTKSWTLIDLPASEILRDYAHDRSTFITTLHRLDALIAKTNSTRPVLVEGHSVIDFLKVLPDALEDIFTALRMDYITLDARCRQLFKRMDKSVMGLPPIREWACCQSWEGHTDRAFVIAGHVMNEMQEAELVEKECLNCFQQFETPQTDLAKKVVGQYLELLAENSE